MNQLLKMINRSKVLEFIFRWLINDAEITFIWIKNHWVFGRSYFWTKFAWNHSNTRSNTNIRSTEQNLKTLFSLGFRTKFEKKNSRWTSFQMQRQFRTSLQMRNFVTKIEKLKNKKSPKKSIPKTLLFRNNKNLYSK